MLSDLKRRAREEQFNPSILGIFINPFYLARRALRREIAALARQVDGGRLVDVGCGRKPYRDLFVVSQYTGLEIDSPFARARGIADEFYDGHTFPFADHSFDVAICNQVLEHVFNPVQFLEEIRRVVRPGGKVLITVPFVWDEHEQPFDYARYSSFGLKHLLEERGFRVLVQRKTLGNFAVLAQLLNAYLYKCTRTRFEAINLMAIVFLMAPVTILGILMSWLLPRNEDLFLDSVVLAERV